MWPTLCVLSPLWLFIASKNASKSRSVCFKKDIAQKNARVTHAFCLWSPQGFTTPNTSAGTDAEAALAPLLNGKCYAVDNPPEDLLRHVEDAASLAVD